MTQAAGSQQGSLGHVLVQAREQIAAEDSAAALVVMQDALSQYPDEPDVFTCLSEILLTRGDYDRALMCAANAAALAPESLGTALSLANALFELVRNGGAPETNMLDAACRFAKRHESAELNRLLAEVFWNLGDHDRSREQAFASVTHDPKHCQAHIAALISAHANEDYVRAYGHLRQTLSLDTPRALHRLINEFSPQLTKVLDETKHAPDVAAWLDHEFRPNSVVNYLTGGDFSRENKEKARRRREQLIDNDIPSCALVTMGKSGSVTISQILQAGFDLVGTAYSLVNLQVVPAWARDFARGGAFYCTHLIATPENVAALKDAGLTKIILHARDPRQVILSYVHHCERYPNERPELLAIGFDDMSMEERIDWFLGKPWRHFIEWLNLWIQAMDKLDVRVFTFEEFVADRDTYVDRLIAAYGGDPIRFDRTAALADATGKDFHRRKGQTDEWRDVFTPAQIERVNRDMRDEFFEKFGWKR